MKTSLTDTDSESFDESFKENFTTSRHHMWKFGKMIYQKVDSGISKILMFPRAMR